MVVQPYRAWVADPLCEWKAKTATNNADVLAERLFCYWSALDRSKIGDAATVRGYRSYLRKDVCEDFGLVWDIHDGHKHMKLDRVGRQITSSAQTGLSEIGYGEGYYGEGAYGGAKQIVIEMDNGQKRALSSVMDNVMKMWEKVLSEMGL